jgi:hypothetical protein
LRSAEGDISLSPSRLPCHQNVTNVQLLSLYFRNLDKPSHLDIAGAGQVSPGSPCGSLESSHYELFPAAKLGWQNCQLTPRRFTATI